MKKIKDYEILSYIGNDTNCDDCEEGAKTPALWVIVGAGVNGYLYVCNEHLHEFINNVEQDY